ncbi:tetratricopeptide repeat protein [Candidatus Clavichlamydia salmonicola]|uniref:tetratricopeptide repeat protein n=1 Tax=Candidatus Clavichlamydia salmonicola TaxID=469812 RepID=UPI001891CB7C|nr:outer membrane protein assembly factor BamD [Candidatus Clavichlamydia salmonicola]
MKRFVFFCLFIVSSSFWPLSAQPHILKRTLINAKKKPLSSPEIYIKNGKTYLDAGNGEKALNCFFKVITHFKGCPSLYNEALFLAGKAFMELGEPDRANRLLNNYLEQELSPKHFEEVFQIKYGIAESYRQNDRRLLRTSAVKDGSQSVSPAILIYDQICSILPNNKTAAMALYRKACFLQEQKNYSDALSTFRELITQFSSHPLATKAFLNINEIFLTQLQEEPQNPYILPQAELSLKLFQSKFPSSEDLPQATALVTEMKEVLAEALFNTGKFYENKRKHESSLVYYKMLNKIYPESRAAQKGNIRVTILKNQKMSKSKTQK